MKEKIRQILSQRERRTIEDPRATRAAVLIPLYRYRGECHILFVRRTETVKYHKGEISFPGGVYSGEDSTLEATALREGQEEIGLREEDVELLGVLDDARTITTNFVVSPFVGVIPYPYPFKLSREEIEEVIGVPISALLDKDQPDHIPEYLYGGHVIWGATARILKQFLNLVFKQSAR